MSLGIIYKSQQFPACSNDLYLQSLSLISFWKFSSFQYLCSRSLFIQHNIIIMNSPTIYRNRLAKLDKSYRRGKHIQHLAEIQMSTQRQFIVKEPYKQLLYSNVKQKDIDFNRKSEIELQNTILLNKIIKIKSNQKSSSYWLKDRSHSLNQIVRNKSRKNIDDQNMKMKKRMNEQKSSIRLNKLVEDSKMQEKRMTSISMLEKYRLPELNPERDNSIGSKSIESIRNSHNTRYQKLKLDLSYQNDKGNWDRLSKGKTKINPVQKLIKDEQEIS